MNSNPEVRPFSALPTLPAPLDPEFQAGKRLYAEQWGDAVVTNTYLKITILALCLLCAGSIYIAYATVKKIDTFHTRYIRIDTIGRAEAVSYDDLNYKPQEKEIKYFLTEFCRLYYSRNKLTLRDDFRRALLFMDTQLADSTLSGWTRNKIIDDFLSSSAPDQEVKVNRIDIEDLLLVQVWTVAEGESTPVRRSLSNLVADNGQREIFDIVRANAKAQSDPHRPISFWP